MFLYVQLDDRLIKEIDKIDEYSKDLKIKKEAISVLLRKSDVVRRDQKIQEIVDSLFEDNNKYKKYQNKKLLKAYIEQNTQKVSVRFQDLVQMTRLATYGIIEGEASNDIFFYPSIILKKVKKIKENNTGYNVRVDWEYSPNKHEDEEKHLEFVVK